MRTSQYILTSAILVSALLLAGCSTEPVVAPTETIDAEQLATVQLSDTQTAAITVAFTGLDYDYDPATSAAKLAEWSTLVVTGTVKQIQEGRISGVSTDQIVDARTIVIVIETSKVVAGTAETKGDGLIYVEISSPGGRPATAYARAIPVGTAIAAYLLLAPTGTDEVNPFQNATAGRPDGVPLYMPSNPQSLIVELQAGGVSLLLDSDARKGTLTDVLPGGSLVLGAK